MRNRRLSPWRSSHPKNICFNSNIVPRHGDFFFYLFGCGERVDSHAPPPCNLLVSVQRRSQGLTGLANTIPNAKFQGLRQILHADGMVFDAEYQVLYRGSA